LLGGIGFCGSLTTFSSWMLDLVRLGQQGQGLAGLALLVASLVLGLAAAAAGLALSRARFRPPGPPRSLR
jgi:CrcB protein